MIEKFRIREGSIQQGRSPEPKLSGGLWGVNAPLPAGERRPRASCYHPVLRASVVIPTVGGGEPLERCVAALEAQTFPDFVIVVADNSGRKVAAGVAGRPRVEVVESAGNVGFGAAVNAGWRAHPAEFLLTINDDAYASPGWLAALVQAAESDAGVGMCASRIVLRNSPEKLDSAGLAIYPDGTTKQRGHGLPAGTYPDREEVLLPSGCAALYKREMIDRIGGFDESYFLYGEDAELGLRGRLAGWKCLYEPSAVVQHDYSTSAGPASPLKAFYVERNRLFTVAKLFPVGAWPGTAAHALRRYWHHWRAASGGGGLAGELRRTEGVSGLGWAVVKAHFAALAHLPRLWRERADGRNLAGLIRRFGISAKEIAEQ